MGLQSYFDIDASLNEMKRVCKENGTILIIGRGLSKISLYNQYLQFRAAKDLMETGQVEHLDFDALIKRHGFKIVHQERRNMGMTYVYIL